MSCVDLSANAFTEIPDTCICTPFQRALNDIIIYKIDTDYKKNVFANFLMSCTWFLGGGWWLKKIPNRHYRFFMTEQMLRSAMDSQGLEHVKIVAPDSADWEFIKDFLRDRDLARSTDVIGFVDNSSIVRLTTESLDCHHSCQTVNRVIRLSPESLDCHQHC